MIRFSPHACVAQAALLAVCALGSVACGDGPASPTPVSSVPYGETTFAVVVNPVINSLNASSVPSPGAVRSGVALAVDGGLSATTDGDGVAVLAPVTPGNRTMSASGGGLNGQVSVDIDSQDLRELALALNTNGAAIMTNIRYAFGGRVVEVTPSMTLTAVNAALAESNLIVFFRGGTYTGDLVFSGSSATLYGEGPRGGAVVINGNVAVSGSDNRIRGTRINGSLQVPGSGFGMSFSRVAGAFNLSGSGAMLLNNSLCSSVSVTGSNATVIGNSGMAPIGPAADC